ncbi:MAG: ATP-binding protein [Bacteroidetes bacterium]|nr:ATP-binding protein [Bacteroidota bacterium]
MKKTLKYDIVDLISNIYNSHADIYSSENNRKEHLSNLKIIQNFFEINEKMAVLFCVMIFKQLIGEPMSVNKITERMGLTPIERIYIQTEIKILRKKGWLKTLVRKHSSISDEYLILDFIIDAVMKNNKKMLKLRKVNDINESLIEIGKYIITIMDEFRNNELTEVVIEYLKNYQNYGLVNNILSNKKLLDEEKLILVYMCSEHQHGLKELNFEENLSFFYYSKSELYLKVKRGIINEKSALFKDAYIEYIYPVFADLSCVRLTEKVTELIGDSKVMSTKQSFKVKFCTLIEPEKITPQQLFFNDNLNEQLINIENRLSFDNYNILCRNLTKKGLKPGLTILFYGFPGTGKTEFARQLSLKTNRPLLMVDISAIRSMWVGESEKNIKKVFEEYYFSLKHFDTSPILLFNESDAIIGKRKETTSSTDQMMNTIQNIILQELEDFTGIFIATTNLEKNFDEAFDRRILYKLKFDLPDKQTTYRILQNEFSEVNEELLLKISNNYDLSGGQIYNIKKKFLINSILEISEDINSDDYLINLVKDECSYRNKGIKSIGYKLIA